MAERPVFRKVFQMDPVLEQVKTALKMLKANEPDDTPMPNTDLTLGQYLLSIGIKEEAYYENLFANK